MLLSESKKYFRTNALNRTGCGTLTRRNWLFHQMLADPLVWQIHGLREGLEVTWYWVKAHIGTVGNKTADRLEKQGAALPDTIEPVKYSPRSIKCMIRREFLIFWQLRWEVEKTGRDVFQVLLRVSEGRAWTSPLINWFLTGHGPFPVYCRRFRVRLLRHPCLFGTSPVPATSEHHIVEFISTRPLRERFCPRLTAASVRH